MDHSPRRPTSKKKTVGREPVPLEIKNHDQSASTYGDQQELRLLHFTVLARSSRQQHRDEVGTPVDAARHDAHLRRILIHGWGNQDLGTVFRLDGRMQGAGLDEYCVVNACGTWTKSKVDLKN